MSEHNQKSGMTELLDDCIERFDKLFDEDISDEETQEWLDRNVVTSNNSGN